MTFAEYHNRTRKALGGLLLSLLGVLVLDVLWQVITRFLLGDPSTWTEELARFLLIWLGCLGAALGVGEGFHLEMDYFLQKAGSGGRKVMNRAIQVITLFVAAAVFLYGGGRLMWIAQDLGQTSPALGIPIAWVYLALPLSGAFMVFSCIYHLRHPAEQARSTEPID